MRLCSRQVRKVLHSPHHHLFYDSAGKFCPDIMLHILSVAGITDNAEVYADEFLRLCENQVLIDIIKRQPQEQQQQFQQKIAGVTDKGKIQEVINEYISAKQYKTTLEQASQVLFKQCIDTILPTLSQGRLKNLQVFIQSLQTAS